MQPWSGMWVFPSQRERKKVNYKNHLWNVQGRKQIPRVYESEENTQVSKDA